MCFLLLVVLTLLIDPSLSFTTISNRKRGSSRRRSFSTSISHIETQHDYCTESQPTLGRISLPFSPLSLQMTRKGSNSNFDHRNPNQDDDNYYGNEKKETEYSTDYYGSSSYYEEGGNDNDNVEGNLYRRDLQKFRTLSDSASDANYYDDDDEEMVVMNNDDEDDNGSSRGRGGYYQVSFNEDVDPSETEIDWEMCVSSSDPNDKRIGKTQALVLLPPAAVERPTAVIHFVGGTFFGSNPKLWYRSLLESIVRSTSVAIVVTPIPVTLFRNPLQHVQLSQKLQASFKHAWLTVLEDEYGTDALQDIPLCGLGHSLGARLLTVLTTLNQNAPIQIDRQGRAATSYIPPYKSMCLISFTNYGAKLGIPGLAALRKQSKKRKRYKNKEEKSDQRSRGRKSFSKNRYRYDDEYDDGYEADANDLTTDEEWAELVEELQETVSEQANRIQTALTPNVKDLEFVPSPDRLWKAISDDVRYDVNTTLVVQFDDDPIDQSSQLAQTLHVTNSSDVRFARLRGNHLTPVSVTDDNHDDKRDGTDEIGVARARKRRRRQTSAGRFGAMIENTIKGNNKNRRDKIAMRDLRLSIISFITDVVTK